ATGSRAQRLKYQFAVGMHGDDDDVYFWQNFLYLLRAFYAIHPGQLQIHQNDVGAVAFQVAEGFFTVVVCAHHLVPTHTTDEQGISLSYHFIVLDDRDPANV